MRLGPLIDSHCHLSVYDDPGAVIAGAQAAEVSIVAVTEDPEQYRRLKLRVGARTGVEVALGLHPLRAARLGANDLARFFRFLPDAQWIGEVGLDFSPAGIDSKREQLKVFDTVLTQAQPGRHPMTVHSRGAAGDVIARLADAQLPAVLHWYTGPLNLIDRALSAGLYFSINPAMIKSRRIVELLNLIPSERILLETDGPFTKTAGRASRPTDLPDVVRTLALAWGVDPHSAAETIRGNYGVLLGRAGAAPGQ